MSYDRQQTASAAAKTVAHVASVVAEKKGVACAKPMEKSSQARLQTAHASINHVEKTTCDPLGAWSDDEDIDDIEEE